METIRKCTLDDVTQIAELSRLWADEAVTFAYPASNAEKISKRLGDYFTEGPDRRIYARGYSNFPISYIPFKLPISGDLRSLCSPGLQGRSDRVSIGRPHDC
jgi:hypothetical protein